MPLHPAGGRFGQRALKFTQNRCRLVGRSIVHYDNFDAVEQRRVPEEFEPFEAGAYQVLLVVHGNKNGKCRRGFH